MASKVMDTVHGEFAPAPPAIQRQVREIIGRSYRKVISGNPDDGFLITVPDLPGCMTAGATEKEALANLPEAMAAWIESALMDGEPVPEPTSVPETRYSGQFRVRLPRTLHRQLAERAHDEGVSLNQLTVALLAKGLR